MGVNPISAINGTIQSAIALASQKTGIDFNYLMGQAQVESGLRADAHAPTSSASGLYQFVEQSWMAVVKKHGAEHGLGWAADAIQTGANGRLTVSDPATKQAILDLRNDPQTAALMAAEHAADNKASIEGTLGRPATGTDLYMAHFLGLGGARSFLSTLASSPDRIGAAMFPAAARANRSIFYGDNGQPRTLAEIYDRFSTKLDRGAASAGATGLASTVMGLGSSALGLTTPAVGNNPILAALNNGDTTIIPGTGETSTSSATQWAQATLSQLGSQIGGTGGRALNDALLRPTPNMARVAYMMLASLGA